MTATPSLPAEKTREIVAEYATRDGFGQAVQALLAAGFERTDLSVLASHDSLEVSAEHQDAGADIGVALASQLSWLGPVVIAGVLIAAAGPVGVAIAAVAAAGAGAVALKPMLAEVVEHVHAEGFAGAVAAGRILLWVRTADGETVARAETILTETGGTGLTRLARPQREAPAE